MINTTCFLFVTFVLVENQARIASTGEMQTQNQVGGLIAFARWFLLSFATQAREIT